jgi:hypothetical protein
MDAPHAVGKYSHTFFEERGYLFMLKALGKAALVLMITLAMLEVSAQAVWWGKDCVTLSERELCLLPYPILSQRHIEILAQQEEAEKAGTSYLRFEPDLGWSIRPDSEGTLGGTHYAANEIGVRADRSYSQMPLPGVDRIAVFGPSFAHADDVTLEHAWTYLMEHSKENLEVMNWGVPGYGTDQSYLRYRKEGADYNPHVVVIVYEEENLRRNVNRFRPFFHPKTGTPLTKPVYALIGQGISLIENPFRSIVEMRQVATGQPNHFLETVCPHDYFCVQDAYRVHPLDLLKSYRFVRTLLFEMSNPHGLPANTDWFVSYADPLQTETSHRIISMFVEESRQRGAVPVVVIFPYRGTLDLLAEGQAPMYADFAAGLEAEGIAVLDLAERFLVENVGSSDFTGYFAPGGHYNEVGNAVVSRAVLSFLCDLGALSDCDGVDVDMTR